MLTFPTETINTCNNSPCLSFCLTGRRSAFTPLFPKLREEGSGCEGE